MLNLVKKIEQKLDEYDIPIFDQYQVNDNQYTMIAENMILTVKGANNVGVSFQVTTIPETVGTNLAILYEIKEIKYLNVMESFAFTTEKELLSGEEAHRLLKETREHNIIKEYQKEKYYEAILRSDYGHKC
ncbi:MAG: hypothetical protein ACFFG0_01405 [Candidatus Thorarchaeota archaeon]